MGIVRRTHPEQDSGAGNVFALDRDRDRETTGRGAAGRVRRLARLLPKQRIDEKDAVYPGGSGMSTDSIDNDGLIYLQALRTRGLVSEADYARRRAEIFPATDS